VDGVEKLELPWPPSLNAYWRICQGRLIVSSQARAYRQKVCYLAFKIRRAFWDKKVFLHIEAYPPDKRCRDIDNLLKITLDALQEARVYENDNQVCRILLERKPVEKPGRILISFSEIKDDQCQAV
jgi:crossover junction endodeoxyribonuclease RusA